MILSHPLRPPFGSLLLSGWGPCDHGWSKHGSSIIPSKHMQRVKCSLQPCLLQPCLHVAGSGWGPCDQRQTRSPTSACLQRVVIYFLSGEILKRRLLK